MDIAAVSAVEMTFIASSILNIVNIKKRKHWKQRKVSIITAICGVLLIGWSNIKATAAYGIEGIIIGAVIPLSIIAWEFILAEVYADEFAQPVAQNDEIAQSPTQGRITQGQITYDEITQTKIAQSPTQERVAQDVITQKDEITQGQINHYGIAQPYVTALQAESTQKVDNTQEEITQVNAQGQITQAENTQAKITQAEVTQERIAQVGEIAQVSEITQVGEIAQAGEITQVGENAQKEKSPTQVKKSTRRKKSTEVYEEIAQVALRWLEQKGELPSRRDLANEAGCSEYRARVVLDQLKMKKDLNSTPKAEREIEMILN